MLLCVTGWDWRFCPQQQEAGAGGAGAVWSIERHSKLFRLCICIERPRPAFGSSLAVSLQPLPWHGQHCTARQQARLDRHILKSSNGLPSTGPFMQVSAAAAKQGAATPAYSMRCTVALLTLALEA